MKLLQLNEWLAEERLSVIEIYPEYIGRKYWEETTDYIRKELGPLMDMVDDDLIFYVGSNYFTNGPMLFLDNGLLSYHINMKQKGKRFYINKNVLVEMMLAWFQKEKHAGTTKKRRYERTTPLE